MQKTLLIIGLAAALAGCGGDDKSKKCKSADITIDSNKSRHSINESGKSVSICGDKNSITINADLTALYVSGDKNILYFADGIKIDSCTIDGNKNAATGTNKTFTCSVKGYKNDGF